MSIKLINIFLVGRFPLSWVTVFSTVIRSVSGHSFQCVHIRTTVATICVEFAGCIVLFGYFLNDSTVFWDNPRVLNPTISPKIKIWTAAIIINFIVKHHVLRTYQCRVLHENIKNYQYVCFPNDSRYKVIKNMSIKYTYRCYKIQVEGILETPTLY